MNILIVAPAYAPYGGVGSARMISLSKYLIKNGDTVTVLCNNPECWDDSLLNREIPKGVKLVYVKAKLDSESAVFKTNSAKQYQKVLESLILENTYDICLCSIGPFYIMHFIWSLKKKYNLKYIIDYRDRWIRFPNRRMDILRNIKRAIYAVPLMGKEYLCAKNAAAIVGVVSPMCELFKKKYFLKKEKVHCIYNGYDLPLNHEDCDVKLESNSIVLAGKLTTYTDEYACCFFGAVKALNDEGYNLKIIHIGSPEPKMRDVILKSGLNKEDFVSLGAYSYEKCMYILEQARMCFIIHFDMYALGTKLFDYIGLNKPIVAFLPKDCVMEHFIAQFENAYGCHSEEDVKQAISDIYVNDITRLCPQELCLEFSREKQNKIYRDLILECANQ